MNKNAYKTAILGLSLAFLANAPLALAATVSPSQTSDSGATLTLTCIDPDNNYFAIFAPDGNGAGFTGSCVNPSLDFYFTTNSMTPTIGTYSVVECAISDPDFGTCINAATLAEAQGSTASVGSTGHFTLCNGSCPAGGGALTAIFPAYAQKIGTEIAQGLGALFLILAGLIGLGILIGYTKKWIGWKDGMRAFKASHKGATKF